MSPVCIKSVQSLAARGYQRNGARYEWPTRSRGVVPLPQSKRRHILWAYLRARRMLVICAHWVQT
jgi:hypothetical protein